MSKNNKLTLPKKTKLSDLTDLKKLARQIRDGHEAIEKYIRTSKDQARLALEEAILTGKALTEVKKIIGFGGFERWCKEHCKGISQPTRSRYVTLYNTFGQNNSHVNELPITNLRAAYLQLGIINDPVESEPAQIASSAPKQITNGNDEHMTTATSSVDTNTDSVIASSDKPFVDAEIISTPKINLEPFVPANMVELHSHINVLIAYLINILDRNYDVDAVERETIESLQKFFDERKAGHTPTPI